MVILEEWPKHTNENHHHIFAKAFTYETVRWYTLTKIPNISLIISKNNMKISVTAKINRNISYYFGPRSQRAGFYKFGAVIVNV